MKSYWVYFVKFRKVGLGLIDGNYTKVDVSYFKEGLFFLYLKFFKFGISCFWGL